MNDLVQVIPVLSAEEVKFVNSELDKKRIYSKHNWIRWGEWET